MNYTFVYLCVDVGIVICDGSLTAQQCDVIIYSQLTHDVTRKKVLATPSPFWSLVTNDGGDHYQMRSVSRCDAIIRFVVVTVT